MFAVEPYSLSVPSSFLSSSFKALLTKRLISSNLHSHHWRRDNAVVLVWHESRIETTIHLLAWLVEGGLRYSVVLGVEDENDAVADGGGDGVGCELEASFASNNNLFLLEWNYSREEEEGKAYGMSSCWCSNLVGMVYGDSNWLVHLLCLGTAAVVDPEDNDDGCHATGGFLRVSMDCVMAVGMTFAGVVGAADDFGLKDSSECEGESTECCCDG